ncbi:MAG TPA: glycine/sarcosine/betaine reductase selenoprotein B family protein [Pyrinomonadaceae bacterium]|nr:glycine/sarcosine/betaine reductase selenoprotein B family protein [Pyrinomonadaceae bacterium]
MYQVIENSSDLKARFAGWRGDETLVRYPWVENTHTPLTPFRRALPLINLGIVSSAGAYIDGMEPFDLASKDGDLNYREIPVEVEASDLRYAAKGYDPTAVQQDRNCQIPIDRLIEYRSSAVIGDINSCWWSISPYIPNAIRVAEELGPQIAERMKRYDVQTALLIPASRLCHQTIGIIARVIEETGIPTMTISVAPDITDRVRPPRTGYYNGKLGQVAGQANFPQHQMRILDECLRTAETFDQPGSRKLWVELETQVEAARGER